ncbi:MAG: PEP-CTERM sorting domain-containing protein [Verrucomicrobia bacterium]|nr:PEP-CTERM sorting domain-containing protein [Verrucomicrobiota bacterium]
MNRFVRSGVAASLLWMTFGAYASVASAGISNLQISAVDMNSSDGVAPSFSLFGFHTWANVQIDSIGYGAEDYGLNATLALSATNYATNRSLTGTLSGFSQSALATSNAAQWSQAWGTGLVEGSFTVSPQTMLIISGDFSVSADRPGSYALASFTLGSNFDGVGNSDSSGMETTNLTPSKTEHLSVYYFNSGSAAVTGALRIETFTSAVTSVPEPTTAGLFLAGLSAIVLRCRRRNR